MEVDFKNLTFDEAIRYIISLNDDDSKKEAITNLANAIREVEDIDSLNMNFVKTINSYASFFEKNIRCHFITEMGQIFSYRYFRKEVLKKYINSLSINQIFQILKGESDALTVEDFLSMSADEIVKYINRYVEYNEVYLRKLIIDRLNKEFKGEKRAKFIIGMIDKSWSDEDKMSILEKYARDFTEDEKKEFIVNMSKKINNNAKKVEIVNSYKDTFDEDEINRSDNENEENKEDEKSRELDEHEEPNEKDNGNVENFIVGMAMTIDSSDENGLNAKTEIIDNSIEDLSFQEALKIIGEKNIPTDEEIKNMLPNDLLNYIKTIEAPYAQIAFLNRYLFNYTDEDKVKLLVELSKLMRYDDEKIFIINKYANKKLIESLRIKLIADISFELKYKKNIERIVNKYIDKIDDKKTFLIGMRAFDRLRSLNIDVDLEDVYNYMKKPAVSTKDFIEMDSKSISKEFNETLQADYLLQRGIVKIGLEKCPEKEKKKFITNVLNSFEKKEDREKFILTYFLGYEADNYYSTLNRINESLKEEEHSKYTRLEQLGEMVKEDDKEKLSEGFLVLDTYLEKRNSRLGDAINNANEAVINNEKSDIIDSLLTSKELKKAPKKVIKSDFEEEKTKKDVTSYDLTENNYLFFVYAYNNLNSDSFESIRTSWNEHTDQEKESPIITTPENENTIGNNYNNAIVFAFFENIDKDNISSKTEEDLDSDTGHIEENAGTINDITNRILQGDDDIKFVIKTMPEKRKGKEKFDRLSPSAIVCYDHEPNREEIKCAKAFDIPLIFIDTDMQAEMRKEKLDEKISTPESYETSKKANELVTEVLGFSKNVQWKGEKKQTKLIDKKALSKIVTYAESLTLSEIEDGLNVENSKPVDVPARIAITKELNRRITADGKYIKQELQYEVNNYERDIKALENTYRNAEERINALNTIRKALYLCPENVIFLLEVYKSILSAEDINILREKAEIAKEEKEKKKGFLSKLILGERHKEE